MSAYLTQAVLGFRFPCSDFNVPYSASAGSTRRGPTERTCGARVDSARPRRPSRFFGLTSGKSSARRQRTRCKPYASNMTRGDWRDVRFGVEAFRTRPIGLRAHRHVDVHKLERAWAAGFLDAEGCFGLAHSHARKRGPAWYRVRASVSQHGEVSRPPEALLRLQRILGVGKIERHGDPDDFKWLGGRRRKGPTSRRRDSPVPGRGQAR